ncbi:MAG: zinc ribbon domain-containing protein [Lautropia sp.]|nr:zinc ribbon domain-containing protein [Lautropia sp.]
MPIYAYRCSDCGFQQDVLQKISDAPLTVCPSCGHDTFSKQLSAPAFQLKGTGWYVTDFRDNGKKRDGADNDTAANKGEAGASSGEAGSEGASASGGSAASSDKGTAGEGGASASAAPASGPASGSSAVAGAS